jgi:uncharacterized repeat protein (TIGR01451 family)
MSSPHQRGRARRHIRTLLASTLALTALVGGGLSGIALATGSTGAAQAASGNPGSPSAPRVLYQEDFENGSGLTGLTSYASDTGAQYTADSYWLNTHRCNGFIISHNSPNPDLAQYCNNVQSNVDQVRQKAYALGLLNSPQNAATNRALSTNSSGAANSQIEQTSDGTIVPSNAIQFATRGQLALPAANGRFVTFSVDAAATACRFAHPLLRFYLRNSAGTEIPVSSSAIDPCTAPGTATVNVDGNPVAYGRFPANGSQLLTGGNLGIVLRNEQPQSYGNDGAIDNIRVLDVTPQLDKQFSPTLVETGGTSTLTFTVTNTSELAAKDGWSFTDSLPEGLTVASDPNLGGTCTATKSAAAGGTQVAITNGQLAAGQASCTVTVQVTSNRAGSYTNNADNVTETGLDPPGSTTVQFTNPSYTVQKTVDSTVANPGKAVKYSVTVTNTGNWAYDDNAPQADQRRATFTDDLSDVLDDATYNGDASDGATVTGNTLNWTGTLAKGQSRTITYSVTPNRPDTGNLVLNNAVTPTGSGGNCVTGACTTSTPVQSLQITKTANQTDVIPGSKINYTITVKNTGKTDYTTASPAAFTDDLSKVIDDADYQNDATASAGTVAYDRPALSWTGPIASGDTVTIRYSVVVKDPDTGDSQIDNAVVSNTPGSNCVAGSTDPTCQVSIPSGSYTVTKTASAATVNPGDTITYTVTVANTGQVAYTADRPASFRDDLSGVLDDATYVDGSATNGAAVEGKTLTWSGPLPVDGTQTITYQVKVDDPDTGDKSVKNAVTPTGPGGRCATAADCATTTAVRSYTVTKTASTATVAPGQTVKYTVTVTNTGTADYTTATPASFTDDLSKVLDDATYNGDATQGATVTGNTLSWSGPLAVGQKLQVTYSVTVNTLDTGDKVLTNAVAPNGPGGNCTTAGDCTTTTTVKSFTVTKQASSATATPGARITYTVTVTNTGQAGYSTDAPASFTDDLSKVLDDATYNGDAVSSSDGSDPGVVTFSTPKLVWSGPLAKGATVTVRYTVTVNTPDAGDHNLVNAVSTNTPGCEGDCTPSTTTPVQSIAFTKKADTDKVIPGETVTYTITATNTGKVAYTDAAPATFTDDLTQVLDDATYNGDANATVGTVSYAKPTLSWSGPLAVGATSTITYTVTVNNPDTGDKVLDNAVVSNDPGSSCTTDSSDPDCRSVIPAGSYTVSKTASSTTAAQGATITYTVTVTNTGRTAYTDARPASFQDNLIRVLDDATYNGDAKATAGSTAYQRPNLTWSGPLPVGGTVTVTYSATVHTPDTGDRKVINAVVPTGPGGGCVTAASCTTTTTVPPGFAVHTGGTATPAISSTAGWWGLTGFSIAALIGCAVVWFRRRSGQGKV